MHLSVGFVLLSRRSLRTVELVEAGVVASRGQLRPWCGSLGLLYAWSSDASHSMRGFLVFLVSDSDCFRGYSSVYKEACITVRSDLGTGMMETVERLCMMKVVLYQVRSLAIRGSAWFLWPSNGA